MARQRRTKCCGLSDLLDLSRSRFSTSLLFILSLLIRLVARDYLPLQKSQLCRVPPSKRLPPSQPLLAWGSNSVLWAPCLCGADKNTFSDRLDSTHAARSGDMNRHYAFHNGYNAFPSRESGTFSIAPHRCAPWCSNCKRICMANNWTD